jgi:RNA polymerase sigma-B factor
MESRRDSSGIHYSVRTPGAAAAARSDPQELFRALRRDGDSRVREALIERYLPLARSIADRYRQTPQSFEDLFQVASLALVKAVDGFDPELGHSFTSYAVPTMVGELKRHFRDTSWSLHVARGLQERVLIVERGERRVSARLGRAPTVAELAAETGLSAEDVLDALGARDAYDAESLDADTARASLERTVGAEDPRLELVDERDAVAAALRTLDERSRRILRMRFTENLTQSAIADRIGISQMQVSRLLRRALERMREAVEAGS